MEVQDHAYTSTTYDIINPVEFTYKMSFKETEYFVKLRISNNFLFSGKIKTSMWAWRSIPKHMGLQHKMTYSQASKKWENMKKRYKELKSPPDGVKVFPKSWPHFTLMDDAMEGRLEGKAPILKAFSNDKDNSNFLPISKLKKRRVSTVTSSPTTLVAGGSEIEVSLNGNGEVGKEMLRDGSLEIGRIMQEVEDERNMMDSERQMMEREKRVTERERLVLERERIVLDREVAALDRDRALMERERAMIEKEKAMMERERVMVEKDRDTVSRDRLALEREKARLGRLSASKERSMRLQKTQILWTGRSGSSTCLKIFLRESFQLPFVNTSFELIYVQFLLQKKTSL